VVETNAVQGYRVDKDAVLFAIDVSDSMLTLPPASNSKKADRDSATLAALKTAYQLMQQRIISNPNDMMGVLLFGTESSRMIDDEGDDNKSMAYPHCYLLVDLDIPAAEDVKLLRDLVEDEDECSKLLVPSAEPVSFANVLFCANQIFTTKAANFNSRRLFIVTDNDNPHPSEKSTLSAAAVRAKDLYDLGVIIELFPIAQSGKEFDRTRFYDVSQMQFCQYRCLHFKGYRLSRLDIRSRSTCAHCSSGKTLILGRRHHFTTISPFISQLQSRSATSSIFITHGNRPWFKNRC
jgi:hypothetical protein